MEEAQFESSPNLLKILLVCAWGRVVDVSVSAHREMAHLKRPDQQWKDRLVLACWN
jgi:hypothetical protein